MKITINNISKFGAILGLFLALNGCKTVETALKTAPTNDFQKFFKPDAAIYLAMHPKHLPLSALKKLEGANDLNAMLPLLKRAESSYIYITADQQLSALINGSYPKNIIEKSLQKSSAWYYLDDFEAFTQRGGSLNFYMPQKNVIYLTEEPINDFLADQKTYLEPLEFATSTLEKFTRAPFFLYAPNASVLLKSFLPAGFNLLGLGPASIEITKDPLWLNPAQAADSSKDYSFIITIELANNQTARSLNSALRLLRLLNTAADRSLVTTINSLNIDQQENFLYLSKRFTKQEIAEILGQILAMLT